jgi:photosystem II stability/assembly factor-like uncharacterized protein
MRDYLVSISHKTLLFSTILSCVIFLFALFLAAPLLAAEPVNGLVENSGIFVIHLPAVINVYPAVNFERVWSESETGDPKRAFLIGENVRIIAGGYNHANNELPVTLDWEVQNACGETSSGSEQVNLAPGEWNIFQSLDYSGCKGIYTFSMQMEHLNQATMHTSSFVVNDPSSLIFQNGQAFDKCNIASVSQMQTWWDHSPYVGTNLYIGGISRYCSNSQLDALWIYQVSQQGWSFIPTWVGPQAPCSKFKYRMSWDPDVAYQQGMQEAEAANDALLELGFLGERIVYYDVEAYSASSGLDECRNAVNWFLKGWTERLTELGTESGVYGATCRSYAADWAEILPPPEYVWLAYWLYPFEYKPDETVWDLPCLSNDLWPEQQRIRQYVGDHFETYGGETFHIDSNVIESEITIFPDEDVENQPQSDVISATFSPHQVIEDMGLLSNLTGWLLTNQRVLWTRDGGISWVDITPEQILNEHLLAVFFLDEDQGWLVSKTDLGATDLRFHITTDGGENWQTSALLVQSELADLIYAAQVQFIDQQSGWISMKFQTSRNFSLGMLLKTSDGGITWLEYIQPVGGSIHFINEDQGWLRGGPSGDAEYVTEDGGATWGVLEEENKYAHSHNLLDSLPGNLILDSLPGYPQIVVFADEVTAWAWVQSTQCYGEKIRSMEGNTQEGEQFSCEVDGSLLKTMDGGQTWKKIDLGLLSESSRGGSSE